MTSFVWRLRSRDWRTRTCVTGMPTGNKDRMISKTLLLSLAALLAVCLAVPGRAFAQSEISDDLTDEGLYNCGKAKGPVSVSFKPEVELQDLITWAMGFTCRNFVYGAGIGGRSAKVTIIAPKRMTPAQAWRLFLVALETMNLTVVPQGNVLRVVESAQAKGEPLPLYQKGNPPATAQLVRAVVRPEHIDVDELANALNELKSTHGKVTSLPKAGILVITDYGSIISKMGALVREVDQVVNGEGLYLIKVQHADVTELQGKLTEILGPPEPSAPANARARRRPRRDANQRDAQVSSGDSGVSEAVPSKIVADERTNSLILLASEEAYLRVRGLVKYLDIRIDVGGSGRIHVYYLDHGDAEEVSNTLNAAISGVSQSSPAAGGPRARRPSTPPTGGGAGAPAFEGQVRVTHDKPTNALVVVASVKDFIALKDVIQKLDVPRRQVFIEAVILEINTKDGLDLGTSFHGGKDLSNGALALGGLQTADLQSLNPASLAAGNGLLGGLIGPLLGNADQLLGVSTNIPSYGVLFQALANSSNLNVLSTPHILTMDNEDAEISVGANIPYRSGLTGLPLGGGQGGNIGGFPVQSVQRQDVALTLKITPHINASDAVRLEIDQEISDIASIDFGGLGPSWSKRTVKTTVVVQDQQSIVIGGLMQDRHNYSETKIPLLGDLPLLGYLFKYTKKQKEKVNLLIVLTPYVIKGQMDIEEIVQRKTRESREFMRAFSTFSKLEYRTEMDYGRKRGLLEEINRTALTIDRDIDLLRQTIQDQEGFPDGPIDYMGGAKSDQQGGAAGGDSAAAPAAPPGAAATPDAAASSEAGASEGDSAETSE